MDGGTLGFQRWHCTSPSPSSSRKRVSLERQVLRMEVGAANLWKVPSPHPFKAPSPHPRKRSFLLLPQRKTLQMPFPNFLAPEPSLQMKQCHIPPIYKTAQGGAALAVAGMGARASPPLPTVGTPSQPPKGLTVFTPAVTSWSVKDSICPFGMRTLFTPPTPRPGPPPVLLEGTSN